MFAQAASTYALVSRCGEFTITPTGPTSAHGRFRSKVPFSRLNCLVRQAQTSALPTFWGLPPAYLKEDACVGRGGRHLRGLDLHWYTTRRWLPTLVGALGAAVCGWLLGRFGMTVVPTPVMLGVLGGALGYLFEVRRTERINERTREEVMGALRDLAHDESDARRELLEMHQRQKDWTRLVEEEMTARAAAIQDAVSGVQEVQSARANFPRNSASRTICATPCTSSAWASTTCTAASPAVTADKDAVDSLGDMDQAIDRMRRMLGDLVRVTKAQREFVQMAPQIVPIPALTEGLRRRLRALVHGRDRRTSVFATREAPESIEIDPLALDRILDNLLTNAAKYTERYSIVLEPRRNARPPGAEGVRHGLWDPRRFPRSHLRAGGIEPPIAAR